MLHILGEFVFKDRNWLGGICFFFSILQSTFGIFSSSLNFYLTNQGHSLCTKFMLYTYANTHTLSNQTMRTEFVFIALKIKKKYIKSVRHKRECIWCAIETSRPIEFQILPHNSLVVEKRRRGRCRNIANSLWMPQKIDNK